MSNRIEKALAAYVDGILSLEIAARDAEAGGWKLSREDDEWSSRGGTFTYETRVVKDWRTPLHLKREDIHAMPETEGLVQAIHQETKAELPYIRGVMSDVAASFLANASTVAKGKLIATLAAELEQLFTQGLPARYRSFLSGIEAVGVLAPSEGVWIRPFAPDDWPPGREPSLSLPGPDLMRCSILEFDGKMGALGQPFDPFNESSYHWQKQHERILRILRLFQVGGVLSHLAGPQRTSYLQIPLHGSGSSGPPYSSSFTYQLNPEDQKPLESFFAFLKDLPPWKNENLNSIDIALERYESALGPMKPREETLIYGIMGLEALLRRQHEGRQAPITRIALLLDLADLEDAVTVRDTVDTAYRFRNPFLHGEMLKRRDVPKLTKILRPMLDYLRVGILLRMGLKVRKGPLLKRLDNVLLLPSERGALSNRISAVTESASITALT